MVYRSCNAACVTFFFKKREWSQWAGVGGEGALEGWGRQRSGGG